LAGEESARQQGVHGRTGGHGGGDAGEDEEEGEDELGQHGAHAAGVLGVVAVVVVGVHKLPHQLRHGRTGDGWKDSEPCRRSWQGRRRRGKRGR